MSDETRNLASAYQSHGSQPGDYATPLDENDPEGDVVVYRADGTPVMQMPRATWDALRGEAVTR